MVDPIADQLSRLRVQGSVLLREAYRSPWAIAVPSAPELGGVLGVAQGGHAAAFHLVEFGQCSLQLGNQRPTWLRAGDVAICFGGAPHRVGDGSAARALPMGRLLEGKAERIVSKAPAGEPATALLCGVFVLHDTELSPLFAALPPVLFTSLSRAGQLHNLSGVARIMADEIDRKGMASDFIVGRLLEVLCAEAIRAHAEGCPEHEANLFRAVKDPVAGRALALIHACPGRDWSVRALAEHCAMSESRFAARFVQSLGVAPMTYVATWRMHVARRQLAAGGESVERIAAANGYDSVPAFNRAFKKHVGVPPAAYRAATR